MHTWFLLFKEQSIALFTALTVVDSTVLVVVGVLLWEWRMHISILLFITQLQRTHTAVVQSENKNLPNYCITGV